MKRFHIGFTVLGTYELVATNEHEAEKMLRQVDPKLLIEDSELTLDYLVELKQ